MLARSKNAVKLTNQFVDKITLPDSGNVIYWDALLPGLGLRVTASGVMTYILNYRTQEGRQRRLSLGRHRVLVPETARKKARRILNEASDGKDVLAERKEIRKARTFAALAEEYIKRHCSERKSGDEVARILRRDPLPAWGRLRAKDITRRMVIELVDGIKDRGAPSQANRTLSCIKGLFSFGVDRELVDFNPALGVRRPSKVIKRQRVLDNSEVRHFWNRVDHAKDVGLYTESALKLVLVTAQRPGEIVEMEWSEIEGAWWTIPGDKAKNGEAHRVPLSPLAMSIIRELPRDGRYVFPRRAGNGYDPERHLTERSLPAAVRINRDFFGMPRWTPHDLRRTAASRLASMGASNETIDKILNHVLPGVRGVYNRHGYDAEKRAALDAWAEKIGQILRGEGADVVPMVR